MSDITMSLAEIQAFTASASTANGIQTVNQTYEGPLLSFDPVDQSSHLSYGKLFVVESARGSHSVQISALAGGRFAFNCGDSFCDGRVPPEDAAKRVGDLEAPAAVKERVMAVYNSQPRSESCNFHRTWRQPVGRCPCEHVSAVLARLAGREPNFAGNLAALRNAIGNAPAVAIASPQELTIRELAFKVPLLLEGERGAGKTHDARDLAREYGCECIEFGGHEGIESIDLLGHQAQWGGGWAWLDGPLSRAFRLAKTQRVILILDEILRIRVRELSILLTALSPYRGHYRLSTNRILNVDDGIGMGEVLECPVENLWVVATTNVGSEYAVDECDPALRERFVVQWKDSSVDSMAPILSAVANSRSFAKTTVDNMLAFYTKMRLAKAEGKVHDTPTIRTMARALELAETEGDVGRALRSHIRLWVASTAEGLSRPDQVQVAKALLEAHFAEA